jgi:hypothetical protein
LEALVRNRAYPGVPMGGASAQARRIIETLSFMPLKLILFAILMGNSDLYGDGSDPLI